MMNRVTITWGYKTSPHLSTVVDRFSFVLFKFKMSIFWSTFLFRKKMGWSDYSHSDCITVLNAYKVMNTLTMLRRKTAK